MSSLIDLQKWMASVIGRPLNKNGQMQPISSGEAADYITPGPKLSSDQRIQIYNQQYWFRLLSCLHQNCPMVTRLFGYADFNHSLGMPHLAKYPPKHWSLAKLGDQLARWIDEEYTADDKPFVFFSAALDNAYQEVFYAPPPQPLTYSPELMTQKCALQQHVMLFQMPFDLFSFREQLLKEPVEYWSENDFPPLAKGNFYFLLYRTEQNSLRYKKIEQGEWTLLQWISSGMTLEEACEALEAKGGDAYTEATKSLPIWIDTWCREKWLLVTSQQRLEK